VQCDALGSRIKCRSKSREQIEADHCLLLTWKRLDADRIISETDLSETDRVSDSRNPGSRRSARSRLFEHAKPLRDGGGIRDANPTLVRGNRRVDRSPVDANRHAAE